MVAKKKACVVSPTLLANLSVNKKVPERFKQGMCNWMDSDSEKENDEDFQPPKKRPRMKSAPKGKQRFAEVVSSEEL